MPACDATHQQTRLSKASLNFAARGGPALYASCLPSSPLNLRRSTPPKKVQYAQSGSAELRENTRVAYHLPRLRSVGFRPSVCLYPLWTSTSPDGFTRDRLASSWQHIRVAFYATSVCGAD